MLLIDAGVRYVLMCIDQHWVMEFTRTGKRKCKSELLRALPSKAEATTPRKLLRMEFGRLCEVVKLMENLKDGPG